MQGADGFQYFIRQYEVALGRKSSSGGADVVLGDSMGLSRRHALITFNFAMGGPTPPRAPISSPSTSLIQATIMRPALRQQDQSCYGYAEKCKTRSTAVL